MTPELPYTHETPEAPGEQIIVDRLRVTVGGRYDGYSVPTPQGEDAVKLSRAFLAAGGNTGSGYVLMSEVDMVAQEHASAHSAAWSMRERIIAGVVDILTTHGTTDEVLDDVDGLRDLPLLSDAEEIR